METYAGEIIGAASRVNYNAKNEELNALVGLVSMLPSTGRLA